MGLNHKTTAALGTHTKSSENPFAVVSAHIQQQRPNIWFPLHTEKKNIDWSKEMLVKTTSNKTY